MGETTSTFKKPTLDSSCGYQVRDKPLSAGEYLNEKVLKPLSISVADLAKAIDVPPNRLYQIINGTRDITPDTALRLGHFFETGPEMWLYLQWNDTLEQEREEWNETASQLPNITQLGWI